MKEKKNQYQMLYSRIFQSLVTLSITFCEPHLDPCALIKDTRSCPMHILFALPLFPFFSQYESMKYCISTAPSSHSVHSGVVIEWILFRTFLLLPISITASRISIVATGGHSPSEGKLSGTLNSSV